MVDIFHSINQIKFGVPGYVMSIYIPSSGSMFCPSRKEEQCTNLPWDKQICSGTGNLSA